MIQSYKIKTELMKRLTALVGSALSCFIILSLCSCSFSDDLADLSEPDAAADQTVLAVTLSGDDGPMLIAATNQTDDNAVYNVHFYFYDNDGNYITQGEIDPDNDNDWANGSSTNVELENASGKYFIILEGLTGTPTEGKPWYVVTVLNQPDDFSCPYHLNEMLGVMSEGSNHGIGSTATDVGLVMSTSTYIPTSTADLCSSVSSKYQFYTPIHSTDFGQSQSEAEGKAITIPVERLAAKVTAKIGITSDDEDGIVEYKYTYDSNDYTAILYKLTETMYVEFCCWKINIVARQSSLFKNIDTDWTTTLTWSSRDDGDSDWNKPDLYRCYWGMSYPYDIDVEYPTSNPPVADGTANKQANENSTTEEDWLNKYVEYVDLLNDTIQFSGDGYCPENTNTAGTDGIIQDAESTALTSVLIKARAWTTSDGGETFTPSSSHGTNGYMYYNLPIKHMNTTEGTDLVEGEYGVVRNHHYTVTITSVSGVGEPIDDLEDVIVPEHGSGEVGSTSLSYEWSHEKEHIYVGEDEFIDDTVKGE